MTVIEHEANGVSLTAEIESIQPGHHVWTGVYVVNTDAGTDGTLRSRPRHGGRGPGAFRSGRQRGDRQAVPLQPPARRPLALGQGRRDPPMRRSRLSVRRLRVQGLPCGRSPDPVRPSVMLSRPVALGSTSFTHRHHRGTATGGVGAPSGTTTRNATPTRFNRVRTSGLAGPAGPPTGEATA